MDAVLATVRPSLTGDDAVRVAATMFGLSASAAHDLGSERDRTFALLDDSARPIAVLKVSNPSEDPSVLDMEAAAALHIAIADPGLRVALPWRPASSGDPGPARPGDEPSMLRARWQHGETQHWVRLYDALPGNTRIAATSLSDVALVAWGEMAARLALALRGFNHPRAQRRMLWDIQHALDVRAMVDDIDDADTRAMVGRVLDEFERQVSPVWPRLRAQIAHTDLTVDNAITDDGGFITGIVDFGDMSHTALLADLASVLDSLGAGRQGADLFRVARLVVDGYQRRIELEEIELALVGVAWATRSAVTIAIKSWRAGQGFEAQEVAERFSGLCLPMLRSIEAAGWDEVARQLGAPGPRQHDPALAARRAAAFGPAIEPLFYDEPIEVWDAEGVWITDVAGDRYLDAYNNVPCVGHGHPRVATAITRQSRRINTHMRYLHPAAIELAERLVATCPPPLDTVLLVNSGSEANDLAWRIATAVTGRAGGLCTANAYHGITEATAALSPEGWPPESPPEHVETWKPADTYRGRDLDTAGFAAALERLGERGFAPAAVMLDGLATSDGIYDLDAGYVQELAETTHKAGGLWIADEVQAGHARTGEALWCFQRFGVVPDFVTLGKPMGNGHPVAAVITRSTIVSQVAGQTTLFSTFGGNPVSAAAALAVLDVIEDENVIERVNRTGQALRRALAHVAAAHPAVGDVRGVGLALGVELVTDRSTKEPDGDRARQIRDRMRHLGVLVGTTGPHGNVLKIRPPLAFEESDVSIVADALDAALIQTD
jgi:4-aminobutyrate aminotransferase-like enzyme